MAALTPTTTAIKDGGGSPVAAGTYTDGTRTGPLVAVLGKDGSSIQPAMDDPSRPGYQFLVPTENHIGEVGGRLTAATATFTRPTDTAAYAAGDAVGNSTAAGLVLPLANLARVAGGVGYVVSLRLATNQKSISPRFRVHMFNANNAAVAADNVGFKVLYADFGKRVGVYDLAALTTAADTGNSDQSGVYDATVRLPFVTAAADRNLYAALETLDAFSPTPGQSFTLAVVAEAY